MLIAINYHYIRENFDLPYPSIFGIRPDAFRRQLETLGQWGSFVSQESILQSIRGQKPLPEKAFIITFDDGLKEQYQIALPILKELGIPAIFFVNPRVFEEAHVLGVHKIHQLRSVVAPSLLKKKIEDFIFSQDQGKQLGSYQEKALIHYKYDKAEISELKYLLNFVLESSERQQLIDTAFHETFSSEEEVNNSLYMEQKQLKNLYDLGFLGSHSFEHFPIGTLSRNEQDFQVRQSQKYFTKLLGSPLPSFSYPYGSYEACNGLEGILVDNDFEFAFTMERGINHNLSNSFHLSRFDNNDLPSGKAWKGPLKDPFEVLPSAKWSFK